MTKEELFEQMFPILDCNRDGVISVEEWRAHNSAMVISPEHAAALFRAMDADGDGKISKEEFVNYHYEYYYITGTVPFFMAHFEQRQVYFWCNIIMNTTNNNTLSCTFE